LNPYLLDVLDKARTGPYCREKDFDLKIFYPRLKELINEYDIKFNKEELVPDDNDLANSIYEAGIDLFLHTGAYYKDTSRRIMFEENEIKRRIQNCKKELILGEGKEACKMNAREVDSDSRLITQCGPAGGQVSEEVYFPTLMSYVKEPLTDTIESGALRTVDGLEIRAGTPTEILAARREVKLIREILKKCGRPGLHWNDPVNSAVTAIGTLAAYTVKNGLRRRDGASAGHIIPQLKVTYDALNKLTIALETNKIIHNINTVFVGGLAEGAEGSAVALVAEQIAGFLIKQGQYFLQYPADIRFADNIDDRCLWIRSIATQALSLNTDFLTMDNIFCRAGPCTATLLYQVAAASIAGPCSGLSGFNGVGSTANLLADHCTGLEARFMCEVGHAATGLKRSDANILVKEVYKKYKNTLEKPPRGKEFRDCYNLKTIEPSPEWNEIYLKVRNEMRDLGLDL